MSTNFVASAAELEVIKQGLKKAAGLSITTVVEPCLPQSKSFLKILGVPYWGNNSSLPITQAQVEAVIANTPVFKGVVLTSHPHIMKASLSSDMSVIWFDIWDSQKGTKGKTLINCSFNFGHHTATIQGTAMHPSVAQCRNCWRWGHPIHACCTQGAKCQKCGGPHRVENHRSMAWCCKANPKSNLPREATADGAHCLHTFKCLNCKGEHSADDTNVYSPMINAKVSLPRSLCFRAFKWHFRCCPFWCHCFDKQWHANKAAELRTNRASNSNTQCLGGSNL